MEEEREVGHGCEGERLFGYAPKREGEIEGKERTESCRMIDRDQRKTARGDGDEGRREERKSGSGRRCQRVEGGGFLILNIHKFEYFN